MSVSLFDVRDKVACVTGASSGLGRACANVLAKAGARVVGVARRQDRLASWQAAAEGETAIVLADLADRGAIRSICTAVNKPFGDVDILINAAGINVREYADDVTADGWDVTMNINLAASFFLAQGFVPMMRSKGWGRIVNFASLQSLRAFTNGIAYGASKAGVAQLTRAMAEAWSKDGINANALAPGFFPTELTGPVFANSQLAQKNADQTCIGRNGDLDDLEGPVLFLSSNASNYVTGQMLFVDGGFTAK